MMRPLRWLPVLVLLSACGRGDDAALPDRRPNISGLVISSGEAEKNRLGAEVRRLLLAGQWDSLDQWARTLRVSDARFADGMSQLRVFYANGAGEVSDATSPIEWPRHLRQLRAWVAQQPQSMAAHVSLASGLHGYAWAARGQGWVRDVSDSALRLMEDRLTQAMEVLGTASGLAEECPGWYQIALRVAHVGGAGRAAYDSLFDAATGRYPGYDAFYEYKSVDLLPRWGGRPGEMEGYAAEVADRQPGALGDQRYARIAWYLADVIGPEDLFTEHSMSWPRIRAGYAALLVAYPGGATQLRSQLAFLAYHAGDSTEARTRLRELGNRVDLSVWKNREHFAHVRDQVLPPASD